MSGFVPERHWTEAFAAGEAARAGEPAWLAAARKSAIARFAELGFPERRHEEWKYTPAARIARLPWRPAAEAAIDATVLAGLGLPLGDAPRFVFVNGRFAPALSSAAGVAGGVAVGSLAQRGAIEAERLESRLALREPFGDRAWAALAAAFFTDGLFVRALPGVAADRPLFAVFLSEGGAEPAATHPRVIAVAERGSRLHLVEVYASLGGGPRLSNALVEIEVGENAAVEHASLLLEGPEAVHLSHLHARVLRDARFTSQQISLGGGLARHDLVGTLVAPGAECTINGLFVAAAGRHVDLRTTIDHRAPRGTSREHVKGILSGKSRGIFSGKVIVRPDAQKTDAQQKNDNLLLSADAEVDSKPQLEIEADDVKCSHGATIGQLDEDALFYLRARGFGAAAARGLLLRGFAAQITDALPGEALRESVLARALECALGSGAGAPS